MEITFIQASVLALIQGITEFLPISSSGHLLLPSLLLDWPDQGLTFDVAMHIGSLSAVIIYFYQDLWRLCVAWLQSIVRRRPSTDSRLAWLIILATIPAGIAGMLLADFVESYARVAGVIATTSILFGGLLYWSDVKGTKQHDVDNLSWRGALVIGLAQALALFPGASRSGVTMTAALFCNLTREAAARFSFLLSIPIILASGLLKGVDLVSSEVVSTQWGLLGYATLLSGVVAYGCIHYFLQLIGRMGFLPFVIYRVALGVLLIGVQFIS